MINLVNLISQHIHSQDFMMLSQQCRNAQAHIAGTGNRNFHSNSLFHIEFFIPLGEFP